MRESSIPYLAAAMRERTTLGILIEVLYEKGPCSAKTVMREAPLSSSAVYVYLDILIRNGLVTREKILGLGPYFYALTDQGRRIVEPVVAGRRGQ